MSRSLEVLPEELVRVSGALDERFSTATEKVTNALGVLVPVPAGADSVSIEAAAAVQRIAPEVQQVLADALVKVADAARALVPIAQNYIATDAAGAASVQQAALGGIGQLAQVLSTTVPQIAQAASAADAGGGGLALAADRDSAGEDRDSVLARGAAIDV
jgi:hypothetical protein